MRKSGVRVTLNEIAARLSGPSGERSVPAFKHGTLRLKVYAPRGTDSQQPHSQDELYVVAQGTGFFVHGDRRDRFGPHDVLFAPADLPHRFEEFSDDLLIWVMFYGPEGGETP